MASPASTSNALGFTPTGPIWLLFRGSLTQGYSWVVLKIPTSLSEPPLSLLPLAGGPATKSRGKGQGVRVLLEKVELLVFSVIFPGAFPVKCPTTGCHEETGSDPLHWAVVSGFLSYYLSSSSGVSGALSHWILTAALKSRQWYRENTLNQFPTMSSWIRGQVPNQIFWSKPKLNCSSMQWMIAWGFLL